MQLPHPFLCCLGQGKPCFSNPPLKWGEPYAENQHEDAVKINMNTAVLEGNQLVKAQ